MDDNMIWLATNIISMIVNRHVLVVIIIIIIISSWSRSSRRSRFDVTRRTDFDRLGIVRTHSQSYRRARRLS
jgi:hypothetical protein